MGECQYSNYGTFMPVLMKEVDILMVLISMGVAGRNFQQIGIVMKSIKHGKQPNLNFLILEIVKQPVLNKCQSINVRGYIFVCVAEAKRKLLQKHQWGKSMQLSFLILLPRHL